MKLSILDILIVVVYLAGIAGIGLYVSRGMRTTRKFFTADRSIPDLGHDLHPDGHHRGQRHLRRASGHGLREGHDSLPAPYAAPVVLIIVSIWIVPFYRRVVKMSAYEYVGQRFGLDQPDLHLVRLPGRSDL